MTGPQESPKELQARLEQLKADVALVAELFSAFGRTLDFQKICHEVLQVVWEMTGADTVRLSFKSPDGGWQAIAFMHGQEKVSAHPNQSGLARRLVAEVKPLVLVGNTGEPGLQSYFGLPLVHGDAVVGTLEIENVAPPFRLQDHLHTLRAVAETAALAMSNARLVEKTTSTARSEERYRALVDAAGLSGEAIVILQDRDGVQAAHSFANEEWTRITGYTAEELKRISYFDLVHPDHREGVRQIVERMAAGERVPGRRQISIVSKNGSVAPTETTGMPILYEGKPAVVGYSRDITERKRLEEEAKRRRDYLETILGSSMDLVFTVREDGTFAYANRALKDVLGYDFEDIMGRHFKEFIPREMRPLMQDKWDQVQRGIGGVYETQVFRKDGSIAHCLVSHSRLEGFDEYLGILKDISERKRSEDELRALTSRLVNVQEDERRFVAKELHDQVGQCITGLKLSLDALERLPPEKAAAKAKEAKEILDELMAQVRNISLELRPPMLDDLGLLAALVWHFERYTSRTGVQVHFNHRNLDGPMSDPVKVAAYRIVQEALTNVARYAQVKEVYVKVYAGQGRLRLEVEDHGVGFDPRKTMEQRACCGLTGMRERATALGGRLTIEPAPGSGTRVTADLPLVQRTRKEKGGTRRK